MSIETLLRGESKNVEYKLTPPSRSINYTKTAVAFANGRVVAWCSASKTRRFAWWALPKTKCLR